MQFLISLPRTPLTVPSVISLYLNLQLWVVYTDGGRSSYSLLNFYSMRECVKSDLEWVRIQYLNLISCKAAILLIIAQILGIQMTYIYKETSLEIMEWRISLQLL